MIGINIFGILNLTIKEKGTISHQGKVLESINCVVTLYNEPQIAIDI